ncbi:alpha-2-macroglobulin family protein [Kordia algicida OT-1]|uniref:Alpha-2-macroglobulin domain-containing protein n=1 Tax=Kordia algicida OT-1 TaxID=391587 RepID=A9DMM6_9FLAO|nr:alpha-2-macroglobulin family protein [Kordia algicida]EDP97744.1 hypothetical protein KAOT1_21317 [Kordia algicida OT-1]
MKNFYVLSIFAFLCFQLSFAQYNYDKRWEKVEKLEIKGKPASANRIVQRIYKHANEEQNTVQIVRSLLYRAKFSLFLTDDSEVEVLQNLRTEIDKHSFPTNAILENMYARFLAQYFNKYQYKLRQRSIVDSDTIPTDFQLWDTKTFISQIHKHFQHSIAQESELQQFPIKDYMLLLDGKANTTKYRTNLYDLLIHNALDFYKNQVPYGYRNDDVYKITEKEFSASSIFIKQKLPIDSKTVVAKTNTLALYKKLEKTYSNKKEALIDVVLQRLKYALSNSQKNDSNEWYENSLQKLAKQYENDPIEALIQYELASHYVNTSQKYYTRSQDNKQMLRVNALAIAEKVIANYPNSEGSIKCQILKKKIEQKSLEFKIQEYTTANKPMLSRISLRNVDTVYLKTYRISHTFLEGVKYNKRDSVIAAYIKNNKPVLEKSYNTKIPKDYYDHSIEISIPKLPVGRYLVTLSDGSHHHKKSEVLAYDIMQKTNLSEIVTELNDAEMYTIVHRETGKPIYNATIKIFDEKKIINQFVRTNLLGNAKIRKRKKSNRIKKYIIYQNDTLYYQNTSLARNYKSKKGEPKNWEAKPFIFTDRSIYRPGQTVHYKVIFIQQKNGVSSVVPNVHCEVSIQSVDDDFETLRLKTNEFGTFSNSFKIPKNATTGRFSIIVDEDDDYEGEHPFWDFLHDFEEGEANFNVEEYKRPRFEVVMNPLTENITFNDSVKISGKAKALLGSAVTNAKVSYTIEREANIDYRHYRIYRDLSKKKIIKEGTLKTDEKGNFVIPFLAETAINIKKEHIKSYRYSISIDVTDINGETQTAWKSVTAAKQGFNLRVMIPTKKDRNETFQINIAAEDVNYVPVTTNGRVKIYKRINTERILKRRPWRFPDNQIIPKEKFIQQFPHILYDEKEKQESNKKGAEVANMTFNTETNAKLSINTSTWETGEYTMETYAFDEKTKDTVRNTETFWLTDPKDLYATGNTLFEYNVLNSEFKKDGFIKVKLATALRDDSLNVMLHLFHKEKLVKTQSVTIEKGSKIIKIPLDKKFTEEITLHMLYTKFNEFYQQKYSFKLYERNKFLSIETATFRNKLQPGQKEKWQFKILDLDQKGSDAEVLASMYDESLDQFIPHTWDADFDYFFDNQYYAPRVKSNFFGNSSSYEIYNLVTHLTTPNFRNYLKFKWFGLSFKNIHSENHKYLQKLKREKSIKEKPVFSGNITGHVVDDTGMPLPGASIIIKGTKEGVTTDFDGLYTINATSNDILAISYIGYHTEEIVVGKLNNINTVLRPDEQQLDEVVVVAYGGAVNSAKVASAIATVDGDTIEQVPITTLDQILQGASAGVTVNTGNGAPGENGVIVIRGRNSLKSDIEPLFVIDGVPVSQNAFRSMNSDNITSLSVLKDAAATAIYGSRGAGGVVIITTKYGTRKENINGMEVTVGLTEEDINTVETRKNLKETAFFYPHLRTDAEGNVAVEFEVPESLTRWKFQLLAHQKNGMYGIIEKNAVTQKELMVVPNMPRFLREKDTIVISTKVVNLQQKSVKGIASLRLYDAYTMESIDAKVHLEDKNKAFTIDKKGNTNISWKLYIPEGFNAIQYKVIAKAGTFSDGEESALPVLKNSVLITEAKPFWVKPNEEKTVTFSKLANNTSASLKQHKLTLEYTSNPTWSAIQSLPYLIEYPYECAEQTFSRLYANAIAIHILQSSPKIQEVFEAWKANGQLTSDLEKNPELKSLLISETPWARDAVSETEKKQQLAKLFDKKIMSDLQFEMWQKLDDLQGESGGFPWFSGGKENLYITLHILQTYAHLVKLNAISYKKNSEPNQIMDFAYQYTDDRFLVAHANLVQSPSDYKFKQQIRYLYTRSMIPDVMEIPKKVKKAMEFYLTTLQKDWLNLSIEEKAMVALSLARMGQRKEAKKIMESLEESAVKSEEKGMYWKEVTERRYYNSHAVETHALLMEAFAEITNDEKIVQELQLWLLRQKQTTKWATTKATTKAIYALLLNPKQFASIKDNTILTIGTEKIKTKKLEETVKEAGTGYFKTSWNKDEITKEKATIKVKNNGKVAGYGAVYWQYFEELDQVSQNDEASLQISKELFLKEKKGDKEVLVPLAKRSLKIGDLITVRLTIRNKKDVEFIHLKDMRAAGLEPVNVLSQYKWQDGVGYFESTRDASSNFFFDKIPAGVFMITYELRVNNTGVFSNGITTIESMYAPEIRSHTKGIRITVD